MLGRGAYAGLTGTSVRWDFVELPSQIMENWCYEPAELAQWAQHYATGEAMPADLVARIAQSQTFLEGLATVRQLGFGLLDMAWHDARTAPTDLEGLERAAFAPVDVWPSVDGSYISPSFSHIFAGGYSAGYYSYKWAEVLDADAYEFFREAPAQAAPKFRTLLESGGTVDPMDLYTAFRGRQPQPEALLRRAGLLTPTA
jgi:peptidyl-dipeptidase Dcp